MDENDGKLLGRYYYVEVLDHSLDIHTKINTEDLMIRFVGKYVADSENYHIFSLIESSDGEANDYMRILKSTVVDLFLIGTINK